MQPAPPLDDLDALAAYMQPFQGVTLPLARTRSRAVET